jgi:chromosome segregation ATPase
LGLGGAPKLLGRSKQAEAFIKHGSDHATIELELKKGNQNLVIRRELFKDRAHQWKVNGRQANQSTVVQRVRELNIQVDNLCQFLPQDRVVSFAQLSQPALLQETEKAVGGEEMLEKHMKLIELKKAQLGSGKSVEVR